MWYWKNVCLNTWDYLTHHPNMWSIPAAVVWDAVTNAGGSISQNNTKVSKIIRRVKKKTMDKGVQ